LGMASKIQTIIKHFVLNALKLSYIHILLNL
jgi:hypothetical protein